MALLRLYLAVEMGKEIGVEKVELVAEEEEVFGKKKSGEFL